jgi:Fe-S oxidoreductase
MCHHICPIGNATGLERNTAKGRALGISLVNRGALTLEDIMDNIYECACCGGCVEDCTTGWDPVMFTKETRLQAAMEGKLPQYINKLVDNCLETGNAYGITKLDSELEKAISNHKNKKDTVLFLGVDARYKVPEAAIKVISLLEKAGVEFTVLKDEPTSGAQLEYLISAANETKEQMSACVKALNEFKRVIIYDPQDAKVIKREYKEWGLELKAETVTFTTLLAELMTKGKLSAEKKLGEVAYQDPFQLSRDLGEIEEPRKVINAFATLKEMLCNGKATIWAGNLLMSQWAEDVVLEVAKGRINNAKCVGAKILVTASVSEYAALKSVEQNEVQIMSIEELILGK